MKQALGLAARGAGHTSPNPMVGAVLVRGDAVVGKGYHERVGGPHAEINALKDAGHRAAGATLYVTLEPCNHQGRTPPCTLALLEAGISRVVIGMSDPNPHVKGRGAEVLREGGITVEVGILERECRLLNQPFIKHAVTGLPFVTLKAAATLDGRIATRTGDSRWISNERSRRFVHSLRCALDAILIGVGTALFDDPQLNARIRKKPACRQPVRIVLDSRLKLPISSNLARTARKIPVWVIAGDGASPARAAELKEAGIEVLQMPARNGRIDLLSLLQELGRRDISSLLVEGGAHVLGSFLDDRLADELYFFYAPKILGDAEATPMVLGSYRANMSEALPVYDLRVKRFGEDVMLWGKLHQDLY